MTKVSIYLKGGKRAATSYYRFYKYFDRIKADTVFHKMIPDGIHDRVMPITKHSKPTQLLIFLFIYLHVFVQLVGDLFRRPDYIIISRRLLNRVFPPSFKLMLRYLKRCGAIIIWDFDDHILSSREVTPEGFRWFSRISDHIFVASPVLRDMIDEKWRGKVKFLPTTDAEPYEHYNEQVKRERLEAFNHEVRLVWLATSPSLPFLLEIMPALENVGASLKNKGKSMLLSVVCNCPLIYESTNFQLENIKWERDIALLKLLQAHVGLMPLNDTPGTRGKGGFKLIQYLSGALPVVGTAIGINASIINGKNGIGVSGLDTEEWTKAIMALADSENRWQTFSDNALQTWLNNYNFEQNLSIWKQTIEM